MVTPDVTYFVDAKSASHPLLADFKPGGSSLLWRRACLSGDLHNPFFAVADFIVTALRCDLFIQARLTVVGCELKG